MGRFISADSYASTGQGVLGYNMYAYCGNNPISFLDSSGQRMVYVGAERDGGTSDYVIYYYHPLSEQNLDGPAKQNHDEIGSNFSAVSSFGELVNAINNPPRHTKDIFLYLHSDANDLNFYYDLNYSAEDIQNSFAEIKIYGDIYLFSCKGGRGSLASTMASATNCDVIASRYKVSFGNSFARCGLVDYFSTYKVYGTCTWYQFSPNGKNAPHHFWWVTTQ